MLVLPTVIEAVFTSMEEVIDSDILLIGPPHAAPPDAQGDDAAKYSSTDGRVVRQCYRRGSVALVLLLRERVSMLAQGKASRLSNAWHEARQPLKSRGKSY
jgi:hypothetical protein